MLICSDSQATLNALLKPKIRSKLVLECIEILNKLAETREVSLLWTPAHSNIRGNERADELANMGAVTPCMGPDLISLEDPAKSRKDQECWIRSKIEETWVRTTNGTHTKLFLNKPTENITKRLLQMRKYHNGPHKLIRSSNTH